jgi:hypothetical protein
MSQLVILAVMMARKVRLASSPTTRLIRTAKKELCITPNSPKKAGKIKAVASSNPTFSYAITTNTAQK